MPPDYRDQQRAYRDQQRAYREQQKAYWRANKEAWRAQQQQMKAQMRAQYGGGCCRSVTGPIVLIALGIIFLLLATHRVDPTNFWMWYGHWWPLLLIAIGVIYLIEWMVDRDRPNAGYRRGGFGGIVVLIIIVGFIASASNHWGWHDFDWNGDNDMSIFHGPEHDFQSDSTTQIPAGAHVTVSTSMPGDINVTPSTDGQMHITLHKALYENSESKASKDANAIEPQITVDGNSVTVRLNSNTSAHAHGNLAIMLPADSPLDVDAQHGDVHISGRSAPVSIISQHGDVQLNDLTGAVTLHNNGKGDLTANGITGDVSLSGQFDDVNLAYVKGAVNMDGDFYGDTHLGSIAGQVRFHSSRTDIQAVKVAGELTLDSGDLRISNAVGPLSINTRDKDIELNNVSGDITVNDSDGDVSVLPAQPMGNLQITTHKGTVKLQLPDNGNFQLDAQTNNGDLSDDFSFPQTKSGDGGYIRGTVGNGSLRVSARVTEGDINVTKTAMLASVPDSMDANTQPNAAAPPTNEKITRTPHSTKKSGSGVQIVNQ
jgi:DUF4097 and DUF4098 domain-containing protein YvlB